MSDATTKDVDCGDASTADAIAYHLERDGNPGIEPEALAKWLRAMARRLRVRSAAPDLLAACKAALAKMEAAWDDTGVCPEFDPDDLAPLRAAIAKAQPQPSR